MKLLVIGTLLTSTAQASNPCKVHPILKGETALCDGYVFPFEQELWLREEREVNLKRIENFKLQVTTYENLVSTQADQIRLTSELNKALSEEVVRRKSQNTLWGVGGVLSGILLTTLVISMTK